MNLPHFLSYVDQLTAVCNKEQLSVFIHTYARTLSENQREDFLMKLQLCTTDRDQKKDDHATVAEAVNTCIEKLNEICTDENFCLISEYNEDYDDWYNADDESDLLFDDPHKLLNEIDHALRLVHTCIDTEQYQSGYKLACVLAKIELHVDGDYSSTTMPLEELNQYRLINTDNYHRFPREAAYLTYMASKSSERAVNICQLLENMNWPHIYLEEIMQTGDEDLPDFSDFLPSWVNAISSYQNYRAVTLIKEAFPMLTLSQQIQIAQNSLETHPEFYKYVLKTNIQSKNVAEQMLKIGLQALHAVPEKYEIRSDIALLTAEYAIMQNDINTKEQCWLEAFHSHSSLTNYLRLRLESGNWSNYSEEVYLTYENVHMMRHEVIYTTIEEPLRENNISDTEYDEIRFFEGRFDELINDMNPSNPLEWSDIFMKQGIALFLLLIQKNKNLSKGLQTMNALAASHCRFSPDEYCLGTGRTTTISKSESFESLFDQWKENIHLTSNAINNIMMKMEQLIDFRVDGIMSAARKNYYPECAAFIAACGETEESLGKTGSKAELIERYRSKYSRRSSFTRSLKEYL